MKQQLVQRNNTSIINHKLFVFHKEQYRQSTSVLHLLHTRRQHTLQPLVSHWQSIGVTHVHPILEEPAFLGTSMVEQNHGIFNRDNTIVNPLN
jgi:hypothetical protein